MPIKVTELTALNVSAAKEVGKDFPGAIIDTGTTFVVFSGENVSESLAAVQSTMDRLGEEKGRRGGKYGALIALRNKLLAARDAEPKNGKFTEHVMFTMNGVNHEVPPVLAGVPVNPPGTAVANAADPKPRGGRKATTSPAPEPETLPAPSVPVAGNLALPAEGAGNFLHLAKVAPTVAGRRYWSRLAEQLFNAEEARETVNA